METGSIIAIISLGLVIIGGYIKIREKMVSTETKVELLWEAWKNMARDAAKILHTPHEANWRRDQLLEKFLEQTIGRDELKELIEILKKIIDGKQLEFGERTAASNLLRAIQMQYEI